MLSKIDSTFHFRANHAASTHLGRHPELQSHYGIDSRGKRSVRNYFTKWGSDEECPGKTLERGRMVK